MRYAIADAPGAMKQRGRRPNANLKSVPNIGALSWSLAHNEF